MRERSVDHVSGARRLVMLDNGHRSAHAAHLRTAQALRFGLQGLGVTRPARLRLALGAYVQPISIGAPRAPGTERSVTALAELRSGSRHGCEATIAAGGVKLTFRLAHPQPIRRSHRDVPCPPTLASALTLQSHRDGCKGAA